MRVVASLLMATAALGFAQSAAAQGPPVLGYQVVLKTPDGGSSKGELLAVSRDSVWLLRDNALSAFPLVGIQQVDVQQSSFGSGKVWLWSLAAGALSGAALTAACSSVEGDCGYVFPIVLLSWTFIGGVATLSVEGSRYAEFHAPGGDQLRPYTRFPQGLPDGFSAKGSATENSAGASDRGNGPGRR